MNSNFSKNSLLKYLAGAVFGISISCIVYKLKKMIKSSSKRVMKAQKNSETSMLKNENEQILLREQLKRNYEFFGEEGMKLIRGSFVVVVGIGGVGSHVIMTLIRSGVKKIRVVDYDIVTLSSLNRHAFAFRSDVGQLKVRVVADYIFKINPHVEVEAVDDAFMMEYADRYILQGNPDYVIDCIDDLEAKCDLIKFCYDHKLNFISSMGAGAKCDPSCIRLSDFNYVIGEKLAKRLRFIYKKRFSTQIPNFKTIFSIEKSTRGLSELEEHQKENPENYRINENERVRSLPVFASIPAIFGQALASVVLCDLAKIPILYNKIEEENLSKKEEMIGNVTIKKLFDEFVDNEVNYNKKNSNTTPNNGMIITDNKDRFKPDLVFEDFLLIAKYFKYTSSISQKPGNKTKFIKWNSTLPATRDNIILLSKSEANKHIVLKNENDLIKFYGEECYNRVNNILKSLKGN